MVSQGKKEDKEKKDGGEEDKKESEATGGGGGGGKGKFKLKAPKFLRSRSKSRDGAKVRKNRGGEALYVASNLPPSLADVSS